VAAHLVVVMAHIRIRYAVLGAHVHCGVWSSSEEGASAETTHGRNGTLIFRQAEFDLFRDSLLIGSLGRVEFVEETQTAPTDDTNQHTRGTTWEPTTR